MIPLMGDGKHGEHGIPIVNDDGLARILGEPPNSSRPC